MPTIRVQCPGCETRFRVKDSFGGRWGICSQCREKFMLPIPEPGQLLNWAKSTPYEKLARFIAHNGAKGHDADTIGQLIQVSENRRWIEEDRIRVQMAADDGRPALLTHRDRMWAIVERREAQKRSLEELRALAPAGFEAHVAQLFRLQGFCAVTVGGPCDRGIDVEVRNASGDLWAAVQCKRYAQHCRVSTAHVLSFAGAYLLAGAQLGFIFTTGELTRHARKVAQGFSWLTVYSGASLVTYAETVQKKAGKIEA